MSDGGRSTSPGPAPRASATVMLLRDGPGGPEVFLVRRHPKSGFLGGAHVFPGGKVDAADRGLVDRLDLPPDGLHGDELGGAARVAALRETWEEAGVLLATPAVDAAATDGALGEVLATAGARLAGDRLAYVGRWITPTIEPRRFDARFYLAEVQEGQEAAHTAEETTAGGWYRPVEAVAAMRRAEIFLAPPTLRNLEMLGEAGSAADALARALAREKCVVEPTLELRDGRAVILLPGDPEYTGPSTAPYVPGPRRMTLVDGAWVYS